jgi:prepilin-type N-terminal cleavage/methylation domain-containing protein
MRNRGFTLVELMVVVLIMGILLAMTAPTFTAWRREAHVLGAARIFKGEFRLAHSRAVRHHTNVAIRFETGPDGHTWYSTYMDGDGDGVLAADIGKGVDTRLAGPIRLDVPAQGVRVGILPNTPEIPPARGTIDTADPIKFSHDMLSFSPLGTATPGTFYLAGEGVQAAVRVNPGSARVRFMFLRGKKWVER